MPKRKQYPNDFRIKVAKEADAGGSLPEVAKKYKVPENNVYNWRATFRKHGEAGFVGMGKRGPRATSNGSGSNKATLSSFQKAAGAALSKVMDEALAEERKRRVAAEKALAAVRGKLSQLLKTL